MFMLSKEELQKLGAENTTREIRQQPELWHETFDRYQETVADLDRLFTDAKQHAGERVKEIRTSLFFKVLVRPISLLRQKNT